MGNRVLGLDISKMSATACVLTSIPHDPKSWLRRNKPATIKVDSEGRKELLKLDFDFAVMEPTGVYSRVWRHWLGSAGKSFRLVGHHELKAYREGWKIPSKTDKLDALALAMYGIERGDRPECWISDKEHRLSDLVALHVHLNNQKNGLQNYLRQKLCYQVPEWYDRKIIRPWGRTSVPGIYMAIAGNPSSKWEAELSSTCGVGLDATAASLARALMAIETEEIEVEQAIIEEIGKSEYSRYLSASETCDMSEWLTVNILSCVYPFEQFLRNGKRVNVHTYTANNKRVRRDESLRSFKLSVGLGLVWAQSGDWSGWTPGGSGVTRSAIHNSVSCQYMRHKKLIKNGAEGIPELEIVKHRGDSHGMMKVARKQVERFYKELVKEFDA
ncbi:MAG: transposase [Cyanobacteria bacterium P01_E01_bin.6]